MEFTDRPASNTMIDSPFLLLYGLGPKRLLMSWSQVRRISLVQRNADIPQSLWSRSLYNLGLGSVAQILLLIDWFAVLFRPVSLFRYSPWQICSVSCSIRARIYMPCLQCRLGVFIPMWVVDKSGFERVTDEDRHWWILWTREYFSRPLAMLH